MKKFIVLAAALMMALCGSSRPSGAADAVSGRISGAAGTSASPPEENFIQRRLSLPAESQTPDEKPAAAPVKPEDVQSAAPAPEASQPAPEAKPKPAQPAPKAEAKPKPKPVQPAPKPARPAAEAPPAPQTGAPPPAKGPALPSAAKIEYYTRLRDLMMANWPSPGRDAWPETPKAMLCVIIEPDGRVEQHRLMESSGYDDYDQLVLNTLKKSLPFPPLPPAFNGGPDRPCFIFDLDEIERLKKSQGR